VWLSFDYLPLLRYM